MRKILIILAFFSLCFIVLSPKGGITSTEKTLVANNSQSMIDSFGQLPVYFVKNQGQWREPAAFCAGVGFGKIYFTSKEIVFQIFHTEGNSSRDQIDHRKKDPPETEEINIRLQFVNPSPDVSIEAMDKSEARFNYLLGDDPQKWVAGAPSYRRIVYRNLYPGIDLSVCGQGKSVKHEYSLKPGADPKQIAWRYDNIKNARINSQGQLEVSTGLGTLKDEMPYCYQIFGSKKVAVECAYIITPENTVKLFIGKYDNNIELIIDPGLEYSTYLGGTDYDYAYDIAVDDNGCAYVTGHSRSSNFPLKSGSYDTNLSGASDAFVTKFSPAGSTLYYSTVIGGSSTDGAYGIVLDADRNAYITGYTRSTDFPKTWGAYDTSHNGDSDVFIAKLNSAGTSVLYSTFLGGWTDDTGGDIALYATNGHRSVYVTGWTESSNFPTTPWVADGSWNWGIVDAFVARIIPVGLGSSDLNFSTFLGGNGEDWGYGIAVDNSARAYVTGWTGSSNFPTTPGAFDTSSPGMGDAFVTKIQPNGLDFFYSTYLGGSHNDAGRGIDVLNSGTKAYAYVSGYTYSNDFPVTVGAADVTYNGDGDVFITRLSLDGDSLVYSTYLGGTARDHSYNLVVDNGGRAWVTGYTRSINFDVVPEEYDVSFNGIQDVFITKVHASGLDFLRSTYLGGSGSEVARGIALDSVGDVYVAGYTSSNNFPTFNAYQYYSAGNDDVFVSKYTENLILPPSNFKGEKVQNRSLFQAQYINTLSWAFNPLNHNIVTYRIYRRTQLTAYYPVVDLSANTFLYLDKDVGKDTTYYYAIMAVHSAGKEGFPAYVTVY